MLEKPAGHFDGSAQASNAPWSARMCTRSACTRPSLGRGDLRRHVIVAGERGGREVFDPVLDPFDRQAGDDRGDRGADIAGIGADLVAEAAADVGRNHVDLLLRQAGDQRHHRADDVRRLEGAVDRDLAGDLAEAHHALAGFERAGVDALIDQQIFRCGLGLGEGGVGQVLVADRPVEDVVGMAARSMRAGHLVLDVLAQNDGVGRHRLEGIDDDGQRFVFDFDKIGGVRRDVAVGGDDEGDLLVLEQHLAVGQHHLHVAGQGRHPRQIDAFEVFGGEHGEHAGHRLGL